MVVGDRNQPFDFRGFDDFFALDAFFEVPVFFLGEVLAVPAFDDSRRCRRTASTRLPTPRPSRASWVGVEVEPEIFFSALSDFPALSFEEPAGLELLSSPLAVVSPFEDPDASSREEFDDESASSLPRDEELPPTSTAAPMPIRRRSLRFPQAGHFFSGAAVIDWNSSNSCPQASQR